MKLKYHKFWFSLIILILSLNSVSISQSFPPENESAISDLGELYVTTWAGDNQSAFSFSFDDGFISHYYNVNDILKQHNFKATFYILPPFLTDSLPGIWRYGTWPMFEEILNDGNEIGSHTLYHPHLLQLPVGDTLTENTILYELYHSKKMIDQKFGDNTAITLAYPYGEHNNLIDSLASLFYESARAIGKAPNDSSINGMDFFRLNSIQVEFDEPRNSLEDDLDELNDFINWIDNSINTGSWGIHLAHEVVPFEELNDLISQGAYFPISNEWLDSLYTVLKIKSDENKIWIETIANVTKYIRERNSYSYQTITASNSLIEIELTDNLENTIYNFPLSAYIVVPETWDYILVEQSDRTDVLQSFIIDSVNYILADVIPDYGLIKLTEFEPNYVTNETISPDNFVLYQNYPNPFNPSTKIKFTISNTVFTSATKQAAFTTLKIYDILGNQIAVLVNEEKPPGEYVVEFNSELYKITSGVYFYTLQAGGKVTSKKMILIK